MSHRQIRRVEPDGTRVYMDYTRYKPKPRDQRKIGVNKPDDPRAVRFHTKWFLPLELLPDEEREMPYIGETTESACIITPGSCGCPQTNRQPKSGR